MSRKDFIPMLCVQHAERAIDFYKEVFGAEERNKMLNNEGKVEHCELRFKDTCIMVADEFPGHNCAPSTLGGTPVILYVNVEHADDLVEKAVRHGAVSLRPVQDIANGERLGKIEDPFGHVWMFASQQ